MDLHGGALKFDFSTGCDDHTRANKIQVILEGVI